MSHTPSSAALPDGPLTTVSSSPASAPAAAPATRPHVHYALNLDTEAPDALSYGSPRSPSMASPGTVTGISRSDTSRSGIIRRRNARADTFRTVNEFEDAAGWHPGAEPGVDTSKPDGGHSSMQGLHSECQITIVDFSQDDFAIHELDNAAMIEFIQKPQPEWVKCRWINVNGISWDVIRALGSEFGLHRLAIEDLLNSQNRTKADWYTHHAFIVMTCQKLVRMLDPDSSSDSDADSDGDDVRNVRNRAPRPGLLKKCKRWWKDQRKGVHHVAADTIHGTLETGHSIPMANLQKDLRQPTGFSDVFNPNTLCTLQRYQASHNDARLEYMERHSALAARGLAVMAEQVAMFLTSTNVVIAFFEQSADDVEKPILARLESPDTILRQSCDASMVAQAIIDAIIDMAIPVAACYDDVVGDLELDVLTNPSIRHTRDLYIITSEINKMASFVNPIGSLISSLRDHKTLLTQESATRELQNPAQGVIITPTTYTYLSDVYDHCLMITESLNQTRKSADAMIDLIFNTISANQNESMKQLTIISIIFLPLTFLSGYFGQNFENFTALEEGTKLL